MRLDVSIPIRQTCSTDGLLCLRSATTSLWHKRCRWGPPTPSSPVARPHPLDAALADLRPQHRAEAEPPEPDGLVTDVDAALVEQVLDISQREREAHVQHNGQTDDLPAAVEILEGVFLAHPRKLWNRPARLNQLLSDTAQS